MAEERSPRRTDEDIGQFYVSMELQKDRHRIQPCEEK